MIERAARLEELFARACELAPPDRAGLIESVSRDDPELASELSALLLADELPTRAAPLPPGASPVEAEAPDAVGGHRVVDVLGQGGMGHVLLVEQERPRRRVALKVPLGGAGDRTTPSSATDRPDVPDRAAVAPELHRRLVAEAELVAQLDHPGIVPVLELGEDGERPFYTMPVVRGRTLHEVIAALREGDAEVTREFTLTRLLQVFIQVAETVAHAHERGVIHRDLKPANVMLGAHGEVRVMDWGLGKRVGDADAAGSGDGGATADSGLTRAGQLLGTPHYMAPEQARGEPADRRSDVFALGVVLYELLTLERPFDGTVEEVLRACLDTEPVAPRARAPERDIPPELEAACLHALAREPGDRPSSVTALVDRVRAWLEAETEHVRRRELADERTAAGRALLDEHARLQEDVRRLTEQAEEAAEGRSGWAPVAEKRDAFEAETAARQSEREAARASARAVSSFVQALGFDPGHRGARESLADHYWSRLVRAEERGDEIEAAEFAHLVSAHHDGKYARELAGDGSLEVESEPSGAEVWVSRLVERDLVLKPGPPRLLGSTPLPCTPLAMGSYLVVLKFAGRRDTRYPVFISRNRAWSGRVRLLTEEDIGECFVHVPAGEFIQGGDPACRGWSLERAVPWVDDFLIARGPVTAGEYLEFLHAVTAREGLDAAWARSPRTVWHDPSSSYLRERGGRLALPECDGEGDPWRAEQPVVSVSWHDAMAYCEWRTEIDGREVRLPTEIEWEKAARGVDGRWHPWGNRLDPSLCNMMGSRRRDEPAVFTLAELETRFPADVSIYGVRGLGGNTRDWTATHPDVARDCRVVRGGAFHAKSFNARCANRHLPVSTFINALIGFRLARTPSDT